MSVTEEVDKAAEQLKVLQLGFLHNFINDHLSEQYGKWLEISNYSSEEGKLLSVTKEFIEDMHLEDDFRDWLIITYRKEHGDKSEEEIMKFVDSMKN